MIFHKSLGAIPFERGIRKMVLSIPALFLATTLSPPAYSHGQVSELIEALPTDVEFPPVDAVPVDVTGRLTVLHLDDFEHGKGKYEAFLENESNKTRYNLKFIGELPSNLQTGATVRVQGSVIGKDIYLADTGSTIQALAPTVPVVSGDQSTLVLVTNFKDAAVSCSASAVGDMVFSDPNQQSIDDFYRETSFDQISFSGKVATVNIDALSTDSCSYVTWADKADAAAALAKIDTSAYQRKVYVMPSTNTCGFTGAGDVGGSPSRAWIFRCGRADSYAHEMGHNLGMGHAATPVDEYGDLSDVMGAGGFGLRQINAPHKEQLGWLPTEQNQIVTQSGRYEIAPLELNPSMAVLPQSLKIAKADTGGYYYLSYRQTQGFDANLLSDYPNRLSIHRYAGDGSAKRTYLLQTLKDGDSFTDPVNNVTITQVSHASDRVTVQVQLGSSCQIGAPSIAVTPSNQSATAGSILSYNVSVTNADLSGCPQTTFNLTSTLPLGWTGNMSQTTLTISPGQTASATLALTSPGTAIDGAYGFNISISDPNNTSHSNLASATYTVSTPCVRQMPAAVLSPSLQSAAGGATVTYSFSVTNNDNSACGASSLNLSSTLPSGWGGAVSPSTATLNPGQTASGSFSVTSASNALAGSYVVAINALDSNHSGSASGTYSVLATDTISPTVPSNLTATVQKGGKIILSWSASTDNVGVAAYIVARNGVDIANTTTTGYTDSGLASGAYTYTVRAKDAAGNLSGASNTASVNIQSGGGGNKKR